MSDYNHSTPIDLIAVDVDGTLLNTHHEITPRTESALQEAIRRGIKVVIATGRPRLTTLPVLNKLQLTTPGVFMQGLNIYNADGTLRHNTYMAAEIAKHAIEFIVACDLTVVLYNGDMIATRRRNALTNTLQSYAEHPPTEWGDQLVDLPAAHPVNKLIIIDDPARIPDIRRDLLAHLGEERASVLTSLPQFLEVLPRGTSKGAGLAWLLKDMGVSPERVLAIGDGENDIEMLELAGVGVAMANGHEHLKRVANYITLTNDQDGVAHAIKTFIFGQHT